MTHSDADGVPAARLLAALVLACLGWFGAPVCGAAESLVLADFADGPGGWQRREWLPSGAARVAGLAVRPAASDAPAALVLPVDLPAQGEFLAPVTASWQGWQELAFKVVLPEGLPEHAMIAVFTKDRDHLWRQIRRQAPPERGRPVEVVVPIGGPEARRLWDACGHERPWHALTPRSLVEYGLSVSLDTGVTAPFQGEILLQSVVLRQPGLVQVEDPVRDLQFSPRVPRVGERLEISFRLEDDYRDPFRAESVAVVAEVSTPSGATETVRGFYYEGFLYHPETPEITRVLSPYGAPSFRVRYTPRQAGAHRARVKVTVEGREVVLPALDFHADVAAAGYRGYVRRDPAHSAFLAWEDGTHFWSSGLNVRSPYDTRYIQVVPTSTWRDEGLPLYERLFARYRENGIRVVEVWMSSWWLALEWINDSPGFHGVGYYNPYRAWMLDHIMELAEANGLYVILVLNNHGKFGALNDTEWDRNPYNRIHGGFLESCEEYFTDERARAAFRQTCDYIVARWGASPHLLMWKLFSEIDLTGTSYDFYTKPPAAEWHREMGAYLKGIDLYQHLTTTHWMLGYHRINDAIARLPEIDVLTTDAYYQGGGTAQLLTMLRDGSRFAAEREKPLLITEYGGSPHADSMGNLIKQAHLGIWTGFFNEAPAAPMFWWFALVDERDLYGYHAALSRFTAGEDRRGLSPARRDLAGGAVTLNELRGADRYLAWLFDAPYYLSDAENAEPALRSGLTVELPALAPGSYTLEIWDVARGEVAESRALAIAEGQAQIAFELPAFHRDSAVKIKPAPAAP